MAPLIDPGAVLLKITIYAPDGPETFTDCTFATDDLKAVVAVPGLIFEGTDSFGERRQKVTTLPYTLDVVRAGK